MKTRLFLMAGLASVALLAPAKANAAHDQRYCREYTKSVRVGGNLQSAYGTACMQPDGSWEVVAFNGNDEFYDDIAESAYRGNGRVIRIEQRPPAYWYPAYVRPYRTYYSPYRRPSTVFSFVWHDDDNDNDRHRGRDRHWDRGKHKGHGPGDDRDHDRRRHR